MGLRRSKGLMVLFLLIIFAGGSLLLWNDSTEQRMIGDDRSYTLGALSHGLPLSEADLIEAFTKHEDAQAMVDGWGLKAKYGLNDDQTREQRILQRYSRQRLLIFGGAMLLVGGLFFWLLKEKRKAQAESAKIAEDSQAEKAKYDLLLQRSKGEEGNLKSNLTDIVHQLKTPVASLKLSMEIALSDHYSVIERQEFKDQSEQQIKKLDMMLDGLVKISQLETDLIQLNPEAYDLKKLLEEIVNSVILKALEKNIEIEVSQVAEAKVLIDRKWTVEALGNIVENAIKYSPENTTIYLQASRLATYALIEVADEGPGIPKDEVNLIYQRFYRGKNAENVEGSGVGLYLTRKIIEEQGGTVMVRPHLPAGSNFQVTVPLVH